MMRCPKCGSEVETIQVSNGTSLEFETFSPLTRCSKCHHRITVEEYKHQARLDKVLSKFKEASSYLCYANMIVYDNNKFSIEFDYKYIILSLDTVESLMKDLEAQDV